MTKLTFIDCDGNENTCDAPLGNTILEVAHLSGVDIEGTCEGCMACSTCHVIVDSDWFKKLDPATEEEEDMLDFAFALTETSRLGCQIKMSKKLDGLIVNVPLDHHNFLS